ncbi:hypothetical protein ScPMuIL_008551 [Solemya velum]
MDTRRTTVCDHPPSLILAEPPWFRKFISKMKIVIFLGVLIIGVVWGSEITCVTPLNRPCMPVEGQDVEICQCPGESECTIFNE